MAHSDPYLNKITPVDAAVEWMVKGANIGFYFGVFFCKTEVPKEGLRIPYRLALCANVLKNMGVIGGTCSTWFFFVKSLERGRKVDDWFNYSLGSVITLGAWHRVWEIPTKGLPRAMLLTGSVAGILGHYALRLN